MPDSWGDIIARWKKALIGGPATVSGEPDPSATPKPATTASPSKGVPESHKGAFYKQDIPLFQGETHNIIMANAAALRKQGYPEDMAYKLAIKMTLDSRENVAIKRMP